MHLFNRVSAVAVLVVAILAGAAGAQPKAPSLILGGAWPPTADAVEADPPAVVPIAWAHGIPMPGGWWRVDAVPQGFEGRVVVQGFARADRLLVDAFNVGELPIRMAFEGVEGDPGEYDRLVPPWCGIAWSSAPPTLQPQGSSRGAGEWDADYAPKPWATTDNGWTLKTGSPRNRFWSAHVLRAEHGGVSPAMEAWLDRWTRWQLLRSYQQPDAARGFPRILVGQDPVGGAWNTYEGIGDTVTPTDTHHHTIGILVDAFLLTGNPRALDQAVRLQRWACATQDYYDPAWPWAYGGAERVAGWLLTSLADYGDLARAAGLSGELEWAAMFAAAHVETLRDRVGWNELELPRLTAAPDGRHIKAWANLPWQGATVWWGLRRVGASLGVPGADAEAERWRAYILARGWSGGADVPAEWAILGAPRVFDAIPHKPEDQGVLPSIAGTPGVGLWLAAPILLDGGAPADENPAGQLLSWLVEVQSKQKGGLKASLSLFGPLAFGEK